MNLEGLSLDQMRVALAVQETGSFVAAAKRFHRAQSAISYAVTTLESQLGTPLFDRSGHKAVLTPQSIYLLREMASIVARCDALKSRATLIARGVEPVLRVVVDCLFDPALLARALRDFRAEFPATRIELTTEILEGVTDRVTADHHLGILASLATVPVDIASAVAAPLRQLPVAAPNYLEAGSLLSLEILRASYVQIVLGPRSPSPDKQDFLVFSACNWRATDISLKLALLREGAGWGYMPEHLVRRDLAEGNLVALNLEGLPQEDHQPVFIIWDQKRVLGPAGRWLRDRFGQERELNLAS